MKVFTPVSPLEPGVEMFRGRKPQPAFSARSDKPRPLSEATEFVDTDLEDEESEFEEDSPKYSFESREGRRSQTTISTYDEVPTPRSSRRSHLDLRVDVAKSVEGPRGPHLFRASSSSTDGIFDFALQLSPLLPKPIPSRVGTAFQSSETFAGMPYTSFPSAPADVDASDAQTWTAQQVAMWMYDCGIGEAVIDRFEMNDITGTVLLDLQFEDLKELGIESFGKRHLLWNHIESLKGGDRGVSPTATPFQDVSRPCTRNTRSDSVRNKPRSRETCEDNNEGVTPITPGGGRRRRGRKHHRHAGNDVITPAESVSIVAIEQLLPKPHRCQKGERCTKWKKQQRLLAKLHEEHGFPISPEKGGRIFVAGDPGNAASAANIVENVYRPTSEAMPSVVASSDLLGPGQLPEFALQENVLRNLEHRDPQENVKHFLTLQHVEPPHHLLSPSLERPPTPPFEMFPPLQPPLRPPEHTPAPHNNLRNLPKLTIPRSASANPHYGPSHGTRSAVERPALDTALSPCRTASPGLYRFGTPLSEMDVPVTAVPLGPVSRETSQSVPPNMQFRDPVARTTSRNDWRRPSLALPALAEHPAAEVDGGSTGSLTDDEASRAKKALYPDAARVGWVKKRKTRLLRHEWQDQHVRLQGARLAMHASALPSSAPLDTLNIDEYAVACSSLASQGKLAAKLKALTMGAAGGRGREPGAGAGADPAAFSFQLVPTGRDGEEQGVLRRSVAGGKTHHFAVKTRDERIDWMRELMLAKALRAKGQGFEVQVNGNAV